IAFNLGKVKLRPWRGVLPPPEHACIVLQHQVAAVALIVLHKKVLNNNGFTVEQYQFQICALTLEAANGFRGYLQANYGRRLQVDAICIDGLLITSYFAKD